MTIESDLLRAVCERPFADEPRLVYADWLDEHGEPERAEFIRCQIAHSAIPVHECDRIYPGCMVAGGEHAYVGHDHKCRGYEPQQRYIELWDKHGEKWFGKNEFKMNVVRGFPRAVSLSLRQLLGENCPVCTRESLSDTLNELGRQIGRRVPCPRCHGTGLTPGLAPALSRWPIVEIKLTDYEPGNSTSGGSRWRFPYYNPEGREQLPGFFFGPYRSRDSANKALNRYLVDLIRSQATPPLGPLLGDRCTFPLRRQIERVAQ